VIRETLAALLAFLVFIVPGLTFELLRERRRPSAEQTAFREASRIALTSVLFSTAATLVLVAVRAVRPSAVVDPAAWLREGQRYVADHLTQVVVTVALLMGVSTVLALLTDLALRRTAHGRIVPGSIWFALFRQHRPPGATPWVHLRLVDETEVWGFAGDYTPDQSLENRELLVEGPRLQYRRKGQSTNTPLPRWAFIAVRGENITWMKVQYVRDGDDGGPPEVVPAVYRDRPRWSDTLRRFATKARPPRP
jgi:hypothetical protein